MQIDYFTTLLFNHISYIFIILFSLQLFKSQKNFLYSREFFTSIQSLIQIVAQLLRHNNFLLLLTLANMLKYYF
jgi:hypothetical protein